MSMATSNNIQGVTQGVILEQIESAADYYPPGFYASLLGFFGNLNLQTDFLGSQFIPLSSVAQRGRNPKKFVIGVLPPPAEVTGRLLDRSTSVAAVAPIPSSTVSIVNGTPEVTVPKTQNLTGLHSGKPGEVLSAKNTRMTRDQATQALATGYERVTGQKPSDEVLSLLVAQSALETANWTRISNYAFAGVKSSKGSNYTQFLRTSEYIPAPPDPSGVKTYIDPPDPATSFAAYLTAEDGATDYVATLARRPHWWEGLHSGTAEGLITGLTTRPRYFTAPPADYLKQLQSQLGTYSPSLQKGAQEEASPDWHGDGSAAASEQRKQLSKVATTDLNGTATGLQFQAAQRAQIRATQEALAKMQNVPPLRMLINPKAFTVRGEKITSDGNWGRNGPIVEHWGDQQDKISGSGSVAGFYALSVQNATGPGLSRMARNFSQGYQNFMSLYLLYRNNAGLYIQGTAQDKGVNLSTLGSIYIYYDNILYIGSFDSFNVTEDDTRPFTLDYSFEFSVRAAFLLDRPTEQGFGYGFPARVSQAGTAPPVPPSGGNGSLGTSPSPVGGGTLTNAEIAAFVAAEPNSTGSSPQPPGSEGGARLTKAQIQGEIDRLSQRWRNGQIPSNVYFKQLDMLQAELNSIL